MRCATCWRHGIRGFIIAGTNFGVPLPCDSTHHIHRIIMSIGERIQPSINRTTATYCRNCMANRPNCIFFAPFSDALVNEALIHAVESTYEATSALLLVTPHHETPDTIEPPRRILEKWTHLMLTNSLFVCNNPEDALETIETRSHRTWRVMSIFMNGPMDAVDHSIAMTQLMKYENVAARHMIVSIDEAFLRNFLVHYTGPRFDIFSVQLVVSRADITERRLLKYTNRLIRYRWPETTPPISNNESVRQPDDPICTT